MLQAKQKPGPHVFQAELQVGFSLFKESYTSRVEVCPNTFVKACATNTRLFSLLRNEWFFKPAPNKEGTIVDFVVQYQFHNALYAHVSTACALLRV